MKEKKIVNFEDLDVEESFTLGDRHQTYIKLENCWSGKYWPLNAIHLEMRQMTTIPNGTRCTRCKLVFE